MYTPNYFPDDWKNFRSFLQDELLKISESVPDYIPGLVPANVENLIPFLKDELNKISSDVP